MASKQVRARKRRKKVNWNSEDSIHPKIVYFKYKCNNLPLHASTKDYTTKSVVDVVRFRRKNIISSKPAASK